VRVETVAMAADESDAKPAQAPGFDEAGAGNGPMPILHGHATGNGGHGQGEPTGTATVLNPTLRGGDGDVGIIRSPVRAIAFLPTAIS
jgi:hypothetical protein